MVSEPNGPKRPSLTAEQVFREQGARIYNVARRMVGHDADAEDVTQEVLLQVVRKLDTFRQESELSTWLHRITVNAAMAHRRKCGRRSERQLPEPMDVLLEEDARAVSRRPMTSRPEQRLLDQETQALIQEAIAALPPSHHDVFVLADFEGLPNAEIGALLKLTVAAVKSRLHRARLLMRAALAAHFEGVQWGRASCDRQRTNLLPPGSNN
jgi:RNA polymerase sigma-70 factor (ECF subfamily)